MTKPSARVLLDSVSPVGARVTTLEVVMHRFVLAEFNTHRAFSRNSASSRAIPARKMIERAVENPATPLYWGAEKRGMQSGIEVPVDRQMECIIAWESARIACADAAHDLIELGVHKSIVNRLLEPFLWHTVIVTADPAGYQNFFEQRCSPLAQPEIRAAAEAMRRVYDDSVPTSLEYGEWHTPLLTPEDDERIPVETHMMTRRCVSAARCARVSYLTHDGRRDVAEDLQLYDRLVTAEPPHWSPLEHVCRPRVDDPTSRADMFRRGNLHGWVQLRHEVEWLREWLRAGG
jgi:thymidylate synthase ThyX